MHLWYHGTIDLATPTTDTQANITAAERSAWWTSAESAGATAGFFYSLIGGGDRLSALEPAGAGNGRIRDGFNKTWDLGGGVAANRTALPANSGSWPNAILFALAQTKAVPAGESFDVTLYHQAGASAAGAIGVEILLDADFNPYNGNEIAVHEAALPRTGTSAVSFNMVSATIDAATIAPATYAVFTRLSDNGRTRYLYAPDLLEVTPSQQPPEIDASSLTLKDGVLRLNVHGFPGQEIVIEATTDLHSWVPIQSHTFTGQVWEFVDAEAGNFQKRFYRAVLAPHSKTARQTR